MGVRIADKDYTLITTTFNHMHQYHQNLWEKNFEETGSGDFKVSPKYFKLEESGHLKVLGICHDNKLIGYTVLVGVENLHTSNFDVWCDTIYILSEHRNYRLFKHFLRFIEDTLQSYKVDNFYISASSKRDISKVLERLKYEKVEVVFKRKLK